jgi:uncharacterized protein (TIGR03435 family)
MLGANAMGNLKDGALQKLAKLNSSAEVETIVCELNRHARLLAAFLFTAMVNVPASGHAQSAEVRLLHCEAGAPSFEAATVKPSRGGEVFDFRLQPDRFAADNAPLDRLIRFAYDIKSEAQVANMPKWATSASFDIDAKIGDEESEAMKKLSPDQGFREYRLLVQSLLADRFRLKVKTETRELPVYVLIVAKNGLRLTPSAPLPGAQKQSLPQLHFTAAGDLSAAHVSMGFFAGWLSGKPDAGGRLVVNETGLQGSYDFVLQWSPVASAGSNGQSDTNQPAGEVATAGDRPSLLTAIQEQLGLKLEPAKGPVEVLVIEHVEQPTAN